MMQCVNDKPIVKVNVSIKAPPTRVWEALINPSIITQYILGTYVISDWKVGSQIVWKGEWRGNPYEDKGEILAIEPNKLLKYTHHSSLSTLEDLSENYYSITYSLEAEGGKTELTLINENIGTHEERSYLERSWLIVLNELKRIVERQ